MYLKEIPLQVECVEGFRRSSLPLDPRFQKATDAIAMYDGSHGSGRVSPNWSSS